MKQTNREIRGDLANKYHDSLREVEGTLDLLAKYGYSKEEIKETRERLISNLQSKLSNEEGYEESKKSHRAELEAKGLIIKAKKEKERLKREYEEKMEEADRNIAEKEANYKKAFAAHWTVSDISLENDEDFENIKYYVESTEKVDKGIAEMLIKKGYYPFVIKHIDKFDGLDRNMFVESALNEGRHTLIANNLDKFDGINLDYNSIAHELINTDNTTALVNNIQRFKQLDQNIAIYLTEIGYINVVKNNINSFEKLNMYEVEREALNNLYQKNKSKLLDVINDWLTIYDNLIVARVLLENKEFNILRETLSKFNIDRDTYNRIRIEIRGPRSFEPTPLEKKYMKKTSVSTLSGGYFATPQNYHPVEEDYDSRENQDD